MKLIDLDQTAFGDLIEPHRRELQAHCYRMLGGVQDAEDAVQETFLKAWLRRETYEQRAALRAWLYKIATNTCLDRLRRQPRRYVPLTREARSSADEPIPAPVYEPIWLEPYPDTYLDVDGDPEAQHALRETIRMAFIALLHRLPPRQRAVVILQDVVGWKASEIADALDTTVLAVKSALHRARATLAAAPETHEELAQSDMKQHQIETYMRAWEDADIPGLIALLTDDATFSMPPIPSWYQGRESIRALVGKTVFAGNAEGRWRMRRTRANRQIAFGLYRIGDQPNTYHAYGIQLISAREGQIDDITTFRSPGLFRPFGLPEVLSAPEEISPHTLDNRSP
jgi:RNA polymerase sigma-70 factor (ECF subfamily)